MQGVIKVFTTLKRPRPRLGLSLV